MKKPIPNDFMTDLLAYKYNSHLNLDWQQKGA